jgi:hypothetical protein
LKLISFVPASALLERRIEGQSTRCWFGLEEIYEHYNH